MTKKPHIFGVTGWKNSGKTTMVAALVSEFCVRGLKVSTVKHAHHSFDIDHEGTDSWKHRKAGAGEVALVSKNRWALMHELIDEDEPPLTTILEKLAPCDIVLIEGFKREGHPKIELIRKEAAKDAPLWPDDESIKAVISATPHNECKLPCFHPDAVSEIANFIWTMRKGD
jgi:molybdopterin-guanine dinucleotide biosynthesis protein B